MGPFTAYDATKLSLAPQQFETEQARTCTVCGATYRNGFERCARDGGVLLVTDDDPVIGMELDGRYTIDAMISEGAMGRVYLAHHARMSRRFAVKVLFGDLAAQGQMRARFEREAEVASRLEHRNLVSVVDFGESPAGLLYLVMEYIEGRTLEKIISEEGSFPEDRAVRLTRDLLRGLRHLHARGLIHRDLKLENVVVVHDREIEIPKIVDFGVALLPSQQKQNDRLTRQGVIVGTPAFMSPEQAFGDIVDARSDLFSLGVMLYHMVAGRGPFDGNAFEVIQQTVAKPLPRVRDRNPNVHVSPGLEALMLRLMAKHPDERPSSAQEVIEGLDDLPTRTWSANVSALTPLPDLEVAGPHNVVPLFTEGVSTVGPAPKPAWRLPLIAVLSGLLGALAVAAFFWTSGETEPTPRAEPYLAESLAPEAEDAAEVEVELVAPKRKVDPAPTAKKRRKKRARRRGRAKKRTAEKPMHPTEKKMLPFEGRMENKPVRATTASQLAKQYRRVGQLINRLENTKPTIAGPLHLRYSLIKRPARVASADERTSVSRELAELEREIRTSLRR